MLASRCWLPRPSLPSLPVSVERARNNSDQVLFCESLLELLQAFETTVGMPACLGPDPWVSLFLARQASRSQKVSKPNSIAPYGTILLLRKEREGPGPMTAQIPLVSTFDLGSTPPSNTSPQKHPPSPPPPSLWPPLPASRPPHNQSPTPSSPRSSYTQSPHWPHPPAGSYYSDALCPR